MARLAFMTCEGRPPTTSLDIDTGSRGRPAFAAHDEDAGDTDDGDTAGEDTDDGDSWDEGTQNADSEHDNAAGWAAAGGNTMGR